MRHEVGGVLLARELVDSEDAGRRPVCGAGKLYAQVAADGADIFVKGNWVAVVGFEGTRRDVICNGFDLVLLAVGRPAICGQDFVQLFRVVHDLRPLRGWEGRARCSRR